MSQTDLVDRVAKAMFEQDQAKDSTQAANLMIVGSRGPFTWEQILGAEAIHPRVTEIWREHARAAILAVRVAILDSDDILKACKPGFIIFLDRAFRQ